MKSYKTKTNAPFNWLTRIEIETDVFSAESLKGKHCVA